MSPAQHYPFPIRILRPERANKNEDMEVIIVCFGCENKTMGFQTVHFFCILHLPSKLSDTVNWNKTTSQSSSEHISSESRPVEGHDYLADRLLCPQVSTGGMVMEMLEDFLLLGSGYQELPTTCAGISKYLFLKRSPPRISSWPHCAHKDLYLSERCEISFHSGFCCFSSFWVRTGPTSGSCSWLSRICSNSHPFNQEWLDRSPASNGWACCLVVAWMRTTAWSSNFLTGPTSTGWLCVASDPVVTASSATSSVPWQGCGTSLAWLLSWFVTGTGCSWWCCCSMASCLAQDGHGFLDSALALLWLLPALCLTWRS